VLMSVRYYSWSPNSEKGNHQGDIEGRFRVPIGMADGPPMEKTSFGRRLYNVQFQPECSIPEDIEGCKDLNWPGKPAQYFEWSASAPTCIGFGQDVSSFPDDCRNAAERFQELKWPEHSVQAYLRGQEGITEGWRLFCIQPSPPLPTWWRYAKNPQNGPTVKDVESLDDLRVYHGQRKDGDLVQEGLIVPMKPSTTFGDEREFETFIKGGLLREWHYQVDHTTRAYNRDWTCMLIPVISLNPSGNPDAYFVTVNVESFVLENGAVLDPPVEGSPVDMKIELNQSGRPEVWKGRVIESNTNNTVAYLLRPANGPGFVISSSYNASFHFGFPGGPLNSMLKSASWLMYGEVNRGITANSWLKTIVMDANATNPRGRPLRGVQTRTKPMAVIHEEEVMRSKLNERQAQAVKASLSDEGGVTLVSGPPGTGKTKVIVSTIACAARMGLRILVCAGSNIAVDIIADRVHSDFTSSKLSVNAVYRVMRKSSELFPGEGELLDEPGAAAVALIQEADDVSSINATLYRDLEITLKKIELERAPTMSLSKRILASLTAYREGRLDNPRSSYSEREYALISDLANAISTPLTPSYPEEPEEVARKKHNRSLEDAWAAIQAFYIRYANVVFSTCANTSSRIFRDFRPHLCIVDEAGQVSEPECLLPLVTFLRTVTNVTLVGDVKQLRPTATSIGQNEFVTQYQMSLFERFISAGLRPIELTMQYRMHPSICAFPNGNFYGSQLSNNDCVLHRHIGDRFEAWARKYHKCRREDRSVFISVEDGELLQELKGTSKVNLANADVICNVVQSMINDGGIEPKAIMIICYYKAQVRLISSTLRRANNYSVKVVTVDSSQGGEAGVVILDTVTPGGDYPLGFVKDANRLNVALTRARDGLVVVGNQNMSDKQYKSRGSGLLNKLISHHHQEQTWHLKGASTLTSQQSSQFGPVKQRKSVPPPPPTRPRHDQKRTRLGTMREKEDGEDWEERQGKRQERRREERREDNWLDRDTRMDNNEW